MKFMNAKWILNKQIIIIYFKLQYTEFYKSGHCYFMGLHKNVYTCDDVQERVQFALTVNQ